MRRSKAVQYLIVLVLLAFVSGCASMGATNTTATNVGVAAYESAGATLRGAYNSEKLFLKMGKITAEQDAAFQNGIYKKAYDCYQAIGTAATTVITTKDAAEKQNVQAASDKLNAQLPTLISAVMIFLEGVK